MTIRVMMLQMRVFILLFLLSTLRIFAPFYAVSPRLLLTYYRIRTARFQWDKGTKTDLSLISEGKSRIWFSGSRIPESKRAASGRPCEQNSTWKHPLIRYAVVGRR